MRKMSLLGTTALALALTTAHSWAGDANSAFVSQVGPNNTAGVAQTGNGNKLGTSTNKWLQQGAGNYLSATETGSNNEVGVSTYPLPNYGYSPSAGGQIGDRNAATITITGDRNGTLTSGPTSAGFGGVRQNGNDNSINLAISGNDNSFVVNQIRFYQGGWNGPAWGETAGYNNQAGFSIQGSRNDLRVLQDGSNNVASGQTYGDWNAMFMTTEGVNNQSYGVQNGSYNVMSNVTAGNYNYFNATQTNGSNNKLESATYGNANVVTGWQEGYSNTALVYQLADSNKFYLTQVGSGNFIESKQGGGDYYVGSSGVIANTGNNIASVTQYGNNNQSIGLQVGNLSGFNQAYVSQTGSGNIAAYSQTNGSGNYTTITQK